VAGGQSESGEADDDDGDAVEESEEPARTSYSNRGRSSYR
jgi:hypothetical protein